MIKKPKIGHEYEHLLIDGRNALYRAVYAGMGDKTFKESGADYFAIFIRFVHHYYAAWSPRRIHIFWDPPRDDVWRNDVLPTYKGNRGKSDEISEVIKRQFVIALDVCRSMGIRQYYRDRQEADDLIYAFCRSTKEHTLVVSSDSDLTQLPYNFGHVDLYNPTAKKGRQKGEIRLESIPDKDPVVIKALTGDKTDNIGGYYKIGPVKAKHLASNPGELKLFLESDKTIIMEDGNVSKPLGSGIFRRNRILIDLGLCPDLIDNMMHVERTMALNAKYDHRKIVEKLRDRSVQGVIEESSKYIMPFARISRE